MAIQRLWKDIGVPVLSQNLIASNHISQSLNDEIAQVAIDAFQHFSNLRTDNRHHAIDDDDDTTGMDHGVVKPKTGRRRRRSSSSQTANQNQNNHFSDNAGGLTKNDYFFEHQRVHGFTNGTPHLNESFAIQTMKDSVIMTQVEAYLQQLGTANEILKRIQTGVVYLNVWAAIQQGPGAYHKDHVHEGVLLSGSYYAKFPSGSSPLILHKPLIDGYPHNAEESIAIKPQEGQIIIFPPWLLHGVPPQENSITEQDLLTQNSNQLPLPSSLPRISYAFNLTGAYTDTDPWSLTRDFIRT